MSKYPETVVVLVTSHGKIKVKSTTFEDYSFHIPDNISMTILNAVAPGICNFIEPEDSDDFAKKLIQKIKEDETGSHVLETNPPAFVKSLINLLKEYDKTVKKETIYHNLSIKDEERDIDEEEYIHHDDKSYNIYSFNSGDEVTNKEYSRNNLTEKNKGDWDFKINVMNVTGFPELIEIIKGRSNQDIDSKVYLEEIVNFLQQQGVKNIVLFDLTCSPFVSVPQSKQEGLMDIDDDNESDHEESDHEENIEDQRFVRRLRRDRISKNVIKKVGGKQSKKKQKQTQTQTRRKTKQTRRKTKQTRRKTKQTRRKTKQTRRKRSTC
jgi:hypothetical protein